MLLVWLLPPILVAYLALSRWMPADNELSDPSTTIFTLSFAAPLGIAFGSILFFAWSLLFAPSGRSMVVVQTVILTLLAGMLLYANPARRGRGQKLPSDDSTLPSTKRWYADWQILSCGACLALGMFQVLNVLLRTPHGHWDAWAIWNLRARFLYRAVENWENAFSPLLYWSSPGHPPGLPAAVADGWKFVGSETVAVPMLVAAIFLAATLGLLGTAVRSLSGRTPAVAALVCLIGTPFFLRHAASQYADLPVAFFMLAALVCLAKHDQRQDGAIVWLVLAGLLSSLAAWTKNEGWIFLGIVAFTRLVLALRHDQPGRSISRLKWLAIGAAPVTLLGLWFKISMAPSSTFFTAQSSDQVLAKLVDPARYAAVLKAFGSELALFGEGMAIALFVFVLFAGVRRGVMKDRLAGGNAVIVLLTLIAYFFIYIVTPENLDWHLKTSLKRLLLQLWPATIFVFSFLVPRSASGEPPAAAS